MHLLMLLVQRTRCGAVRDEHGLGLGELYPVRSNAFPDVIIATRCFNLGVGMSKISALVVEVGFAQAATTFFELLSWRSGGGYPFTLHNRSIAIH